MKKGTKVKILSKDSKFKGEEGVVVGITQGGFVRVKMNCCTFKKDNVVCFAKESLEVVEEDRKKGFSDDSKISTRFFDGLDLSTHQSRFAIAMFVYSCLVFGTFTECCSVKDGKIHVNFEGEKNMVKRYINEIEDFFCLHISFSERNEIFPFGLLDSLTAGLKRYIKTHPLLVKIIEKADSFEDFKKNSPNAKNALYNNGHFLYYKGFVLYHADDCRVKKLLNNADKFGVLEGVCAELYLERMPQKPPFVKTEYKIETPCSEENAFLVNVYENIFTGESITYKRDGTYGFRKTEGFKTNNPEKEIEVFTKECEARVKEAKALLGKDDYKDRRDVEVSMLRNFLKQHNLTVCFNPNEIINNIKWVIEKPCLSVYDGHKDRYVFVCGDEISNPEVSAVLRRADNLYLFANLFSDYEYDRFTMCFNLVAAYERVKTVHDTGYVESVTAGCGREDVLRHMEMTNPELMCFRIRAYDALQLLGLDWEQFYSLNLQFEGAVELLEKAYKENLKTYCVPFEHIMKDVIKVEATSPEQAVEIARDTINENFNVSRIFEACLEGENLVWGSNYEVK